MASARTGNSVTGWSSRTKIIRLLTALTALGIMLALVGLALPRFFSSGDADASERKQVVSRATDFAVAYNTYDIAKLGDYQTRVKDLLTSSYDKQFVQVTNAIFKALKDKKQRSGEAKVLAVAVDNIDPDSATALVAVDASITNTDNAAAVLRHFRWKVSFTNVKGDWRVAKFESVAAVTAQTTAPSATPTPTDGGGS